MMDALALVVAALVMGAILVGVTWVTFAISGKVRRALAARRQIGVPPTTET